MLISVVVPCFNEEQSLPLFSAALTDACHTIRRAHPDASFELVLIDDGSRDGTLAAFRAVEQTFCGGPDSTIPHCVRWYALSRNFGKEAALLAGLEHAHGDLVATMDADLQDPPALLPEMLDALLTEPYDCVATRRVTRAGEPPIRSFFARRFYHLIRRLSNVDIVDGARDYRLMTRPVVDAVLSLDEYNRFTKGIFGWVGFRTKWLPFENVERAAGESKWNFFSLFAYALDGIIAFSTAPLSFASLMGVALCLVALVAVAFVAVRAALFGDPVAGWPSLACIILFIGGLQLFCLGIVGQYLAKTYLETKRRPHYLIRCSNVPREQGERRRVADAAGAAERATPDVGRDSRGAQGGAVHHG